jgi:electron transfer flavoprotein alpha/beta subunit
MRRVAVIIGSAWSETAAGARALPTSDRGAVALALTKFGADVRAYASDSDARCFARAAGIEAVAALSDLQMGSVDVALIGRGGCGADGDALPARLAEASGAALVYAVVDVRSEPDRIVVTRDLGRGARDVLGVRGHAVLVVSDSVVRGSYVSRHRIDAARVASGESLAREGRSCAGWELTTPRVRLGDHASRVAGSAVERMNALFGVGRSAEESASLVRGSAKECARQLFRYLSHHGFVARGSDGEPQSERASASASQPAERRSRRSEGGGAPIPIRVQRRPRPVKQRPPVTRGPFEIGVDL